MSLLRRAPSPAFTARRHPVPAALAVLGIAFCCLAVHLDVAAFLWDRLGVAIRQPSSDAVWAGTTSATSAATLQYAVATADRAEVDRLLQAMTLEQKVAQLHGVGQMRGTVDRRHDVPAFETADGPHGIGEAVWRYLYRHTDRATAFPVAIAIAASWDPELAARVGGAIAREARAKGRNWLLAPAVDLVRDPRAGRVFEAYGEDPYLSGRLGAAFVRGAQAAGVIATPKHFIGHHHETDRSEIDIRVGERALRELYLPPFEAAIREGGALSIMAASHSVNGTHCTEYEWLLRSVLRDEWGFEGVVVSDWDATKSTEPSIRAGLDVEMPKANHYGAALVAAVENGRVAPDLVDQATARVLSVKLAAGLFSRPMELDSTQVGTPAHRDLALDAARQSIVLLRNQSGEEPPRGRRRRGATAAAAAASPPFLPLDLEADDVVAVLGPWASRAALGGRGSSEVKPLRPIGLADGLRGAVPERVRIETLDDWQDAGQVAALAGRASVVVLALGLGPRLEGESLDRVGNELDLPAEQLHLVDRALESTSKVVVVLFAGSAIAMDPWIERVPAVLDAWYPGELGGQAVAEVLVGAVNPSGKLPLTLPRAASQLPAFPTFPERVTEYREGVFVGYRYFDARALDPLFPFGHGLGYSRFEYSDLRVEPRGSGSTIAIAVRFELRNAGDRAGAEVAQVYVGDRESSLPRPPRELKRFAKLRLEPGERRTVELELGWRDLAFFDQATRAWTVEPGTFEVAVGASSRDLRLSGRFEYLPDAGREDPPR